MTQKKPTTKIPKTWGRESAAYLLLVLTYCIWIDNVALVEIMAWPTITYASLAFGLKRISDNTELRESLPTFTPNRERGSERSSERTSWEDEYPTGGSPTEEYYEESDSHRGQFRSRYRNQDK